LRLLLDTHALLWWQQGDRRLNAHVRRAIAGADSVFVSAAVLWEIVIKAQLGKLEASLDAVFDLSADGFRELPIRGLHARVAGELPPHHKDPFDRMIAAQAQVEELTLVTSDEIFRKYGVRTLNG
jgi:PIN domain nuclease of toxin-antitoxin system